MNRVHPPRESNSDGAVPVVGGQFFFMILRAAETVFQAMFGDEHKAELALLPDGTPGRVWTLRWRDYVLELAPDTNQSAVAELSRNKETIRRTTYVHSPVEVNDLILELAINLIRRVGQRAFREFELANDK